MRLTRQCESQALSQIVSEKGYGGIALFSRASDRNHLSFNGLWSLGPVEVCAAHEGRGGSGEEMDRVFRSTLLATFRIQFPYGLPVVLRIIGLERGAQCVGFALP